MTTQQMTEQADDARPILGYVVTIPEWGPQQMMFADWRDMADVLEAEMDNVSHGEVVTFRVERRWTTQAELDALPDFDGW